jgi:hypothetical protein
MTPIILPMPTGNWGWGPTLLYIIGVIGAFAWHERQMRKMFPKPPRPDPARAMERLKAERFTQLLIEAAQERRSKR